MSKRLLDKVFTLEDISNKKHAPDTFEHSDILLSDKSLSDYFEELVVLDTEFSDSQDEVLESLTEEKREELGARGLVMGKINKMSREQFITALVERTMPEFKPAFLGDHDFTPVMHRIHLTGKGLMFSDFINGSINESWVVDQFYNNRNYLTFLSVDEIACMIYDYAMKILEYHRHCPKTPFQMLYESIRAEYAKSRIPI